MIRDDKGDLSFVSALYQSINQFLSCSSLLFDILSQTLYHAVFYSLCFSSVSSRVISALTSSASASVCSVASGCTCRSNPKLHILQKKPGL